MSVNNDLQKSLLDSMQLLAQKNVEKANSVKSIKAIITAIKDAGAGIYELSYGGNTIEASAASPDMAYQVNDNVYVLIPDGDFSQPKIIIGLVASRATNATTREDRDKYDIISNNLLPYDELITLKSWEDYEEVISLDTNDFESLFSSYLEDGNRTFLFSTKVKTDIDKDHQSKGNYGLILTLPFLEAGAGDTWNPINLSYTMDVDTMQGNPYAYNSEQLINLYFTVNNSLKYDTTREPELKKFVYGFDYAEPRDMEFDIYFKDLGFQMVEETPAADESGYSLSIVSNKGNYFLIGDTNSKILTPKLRVNGKETNIKTWSCYWFVEDASIDNTSDGYVSFAGYGWKCLNKKTNISYDDTGKQNYQYVVNKYNYAVDPQDVDAKLKYRCILIQNDVVVSADITIKNLISNVSFSLVSATGSNIYVENAGEVRLIARIYYPNLSSADTFATRWQRKNIDGNYIDNDFYSVVRWNDPVDTDTLETEIKFDCSKIDKANLIICSFYKNGLVLGSESIYISTIEKLACNVIIENGDIVYKYDSDGDSPFTANYDGPINSRITETKPISFRIFKEDGSELTDSEYANVEYDWAIPINSMIELKNETITDTDDNYYHISGIGHKSINYKIANNYSKRKNDNTIQLTVKFSGNSAQAAAAIKFLKDGESGTNGTKYTALIKHRTPKNEKYYYNEKDTNGILRKVQMVSYNGTWYYYNVDTKKLISSNPAFEVEVYSNGELVTSGISTSWSMFDVGSSDKNNKVNFSINSSGVMSVSASWGNTDETEYTNVIQAKVTVNTADTGTKAKEIIYAYYPIEILKIYSNTVSSFDVNKTFELPMIQGGFDDVIYSSDGKNPKYDDGTDFSFVNIPKAGGIDSYTYVWSVNPTYKNLIIKESAGNTAEIKPTNNFESGCSKNYIMTTIQMQGSQTQAVKAEVTAINNEITDIDTQISKYENERTNLIQLVDKLENFGYNYYISEYKKYQLILLYRSQCINIINSLNELEEEIIDLFNKDDNLKRYINFNETLINQTLLMGYNTLYKLLNSKTYDNIPELTDIRLTIDERLKDYNLAYYDDLSGLVLQWNNLINVKYHEAYINLTNQAVTLLAAMGTLTDSLIDFQNNNNLVALAGSGESEYQNLQIAVAAAVNRLEDTSPAGGITSYDSLVNNVLKTLHNLFVIYMDLDYQNSRYDNYVNPLNENKEAKEKELKTYTDSVVVNETISIPVNLMKYIKPIVMLFNRYEMSYLNDWDGNKIYTGVNDSYLFAPQVGAGKISENKFTGITIGVRGHNSGFSQEVGLFGYNAGQQSIFLDAETGNATFGTDNKITITPTSSEIHFSNSNGKIYSGSHNTVSSINNGFYLSTDGFSIGSKVKIESDGILKLGNGAVSNTGTHWTIDGSNSNSYIAYGSNKTLSMNWSRKTIGGNNGEVYLGTDGIRVGKGFAIDSDGHFIANDAYLKGYVNATSGKIGNWYISNGNLSDYYDYIVLDTSEGITVSGQSGSITRTLKLKGGEIINGLNSQDRIFFNEGVYIYTGAAQLLMYDTGLIKLISSSWGTQRAINFESSYFTWNGYTVLTTNTGAAKNHSHNYISSDDVFDTGLDIRNWVAAHFQPKSSSSDD